MSAQSLKADEKHNRFGTEISICAENHSKKHPESPQRCADTHSEKEIKEIREKTRKLKKEFRMFTNQIRVTKRKTSLFFALSSGDKRTRTDDPRVANAMLYQLSYIPDWIFEL